MSKRLSLYGVNLKDALLVALKTPLPPEEREKSRKGRKPRKAKKKATKGS